jgi:hypothetical protein
VWHLPRFSTVDCWFWPKCFESERLYQRLGALILKRFVPTGGDLVMRRLRRHNPGAQACNHVASTRRVRLNELIHVIGFTG